MVLYIVALNANNITAHRHFTGLQVYADTCRLQRAASLVHFRQVVAQYGHIGHLAARMKTVGNSLEPAHAPHSGEFIHIGCFGCLQQGLSAQRLYGPVGHAVT